MIGFLPVSQTLSQHFDKLILHSQNVYLILTHVKNLDAKTDKQITPDCSFGIGGNRIGAKTLDLNTDFDSLQDQRITLHVNYFNRINMPRRKRIRSSFSAG